MAGTHAYVSPSQRVLVVLCNTHAETYGCQPRDANLTLRDARGEASWLPLCLDDCGGAIEFTDNKPWLFEHAVRPLTGIPSRDRHTCLASCYIKPQANSEFVSRNQVALPRFNWADFGFSKQSINRAIRCFHRTNMLNLLAWDYGIDGCQTRQKGVRDSTLDEDEHPIHFANKRAIVAVRHIVRALQKCGAITDMKRGQLCVKRARGIGRPMNEKCFMTWATQSAYDDPLMYALTHGDGDQRQKVGDSIKILTDGAKITREFHTRGITPAEMTILQSCLEAPSRSANADITPDKDEDSDSPDDDEDSDEDDSDEEDIANLEGPFTSDGKDNLWADLATMRVYRIEDTDSISNGIDREMLEQTKVGVLKQTDRKTPRWSASMKTVKHARVEFDECLSSESHDSDYSTDDE